MSIFLFWLSDPMIFFWYYFSHSCFSSGILWYLLLPYFLFLFFIFFRYVSVFMSYLLSEAFFSRFDNNLSLYLLSFFCFFDSKLCNSFFINNTKKYKTPILSIKLELFIMLIASSLFIYQPYSGWDRDGGGKKRPAVLVFPMQVLQR